MKKGLIQPPILTPSDPAFNPIKPPNPFQFNPKPPPNAKPKPPAMPKVHKPHPNDIPSSYSFAKYIKPSSNAFKYQGPPQPNNPFHGSGFQSNGSGLQAFNYEPPKKMKVADYGFGKPMPKAQSIYKGNLFDYDYPPPKDHPKPIFQPFQPPINPYSFGGK